MVQWTSNETSFYCFIKRKLSNYIENMTKWETYPMFMFEMEIEKSISKYQIFQVTRSELFIHSSNIVVFFMLKTLITREHSKVNGQLVLTKLRWEVTHICQMLTR